MTTLLGSVINLKVWSDGVSYTASDAHAAVAFFPSGVWVAQDTDRVAIVNLSTERQAVSMSVFPALLTLTPGGSIQILRGRDVPTPGWLALYQWTVGEMTETSRELVEYSIYLNRGPVVV